MNIILYRRRYSRWGVDGTLVITRCKGLQYLGAS